MQNTDRLTYSIQQAMEMLNLSRQSLYNEINAGRLLTYSVGRRRMVSHSAIETWILDREAESNCAA